MFLRYRMVLKSYISASLIQFFITVSRNLNAIFCYSVNLLLSSMASLTSSSQFFVSISLFLLLFVETHFQNLWGHLVSFILCRCPYRNSLLVSHLPIFSQISSFVIWCSLDTLQLLRNAFISAAFIFFYFSPLSTMFPLSV